MSESIDEKGKDELARIVIQRYRRARDYRDSHIVHQGRSATELMERADRQYRREYTSSERSMMQEAFGFTPSRYYGITQQKVNATVAWHNDLIINNIDAMFTVNPSPEPELDRKTLNYIRQQIREELVKRAMAAGVVDLELLLTPKGKPHPRIEAFLREQAKSLKKIEQARIVSVAGESAQQMQRTMRDKTLEGNFRSAYMAYTFDRVLYGTGILAFPDWRSRPVLKHRGKKAAMEWETVPWFRHVRLQDFYPVCDAIDYQTNTGNTEVTYVTKIELINMARQKEYYEDQITEILEDYAYRSRNWVGSEAMDSGEDWWELDDTIPLLIHEGFFSGGELNDHGVTGYDELEYVSARVEVCGSRTIRCTVAAMPQGAERSYFGAPLIKTGDNLLDSLGLAAQLWDSEQRVNRLMHIFEHNIDWAARPPLMKNVGTFDNPTAADSIQPAGQYTVEDRWATSGSLPEPLRVMNTVSAQYHLIMTQVGTILRQADEDCGIPAFAYSAQDFGRSSLGEYSQRMSNALRTIKQAALNEDIYLIEPMFTRLFEHIMTTEEGAAEGQDVGIIIRGMTGLLKEDQQGKMAQQILPMVLQLSQQNLVPQEAVEYAVRQLLEQAGFPVDALGMSNPIVDQAMAAAAAAPTNSVSPTGNQVPPLDGRSGVPAANVAAPNGASQLSVPGVQGV